jgi:hypothetical protein
MDYYKSLFDPPESNLFSPDENLRDDIPQVSDLENEIMSSAFSETEIEEAIFQMEKIRCRGWMVFPRSSINTWGTIKSDLI